MAAQQRCPETKILIIALLPIFIKISTQLLIIERANQEPFHWEGCIYRRVDILHSPNSTDECSVCTVNGTRNATFSLTPKEGYRNCTEECKKPTLCTYHVYNLLSHLRPECFQCEPWNEEMVYFRSIRLYRICSEECKECARQVDLATANTCAPSCGGRPTFCFPPRRLFGHELCHQANYTYGCRFQKRVWNHKALSPELFKCAKCSQKATKDTAQLCAIDCQGSPTYGYHVGSDNNTEMTVCNLDSYQDVFQHEIPEALKKYIDVNHPLAMKNLTVHPHFK